MTLENKLGITDSQELAHMIPIPVTGMESVDICLKN